MSEFKVGLIGCGGMGAHLSRQLNSIEGARVAAVFDISAEARRKLAEEFEAKAFASRRKLLGSDVDGVIVATPNDSHAAYTIEAARAGKHIFCEKPMALSVADCDAMIAAAEKAGVVLMVGQVLRLFPVFAKSRDIVTSGELGAPFGMTVRRIGGPDAFGGWRTMSKHAGGLLYELHVHELDFMRFCMGEAKTVYASIGHFTRSPLEYEDVAFVHIAYESGGIGTLHCGLSASIPSYDVVIQCANGTLTSGGFDGPIRYARFGEEPAEIQAGEIGMEEPYRAEVRSWVEAITKGTPMVFDARDGRAAIEIAEAAYRSAETGLPVNLPLAG